MHHERCAATRRGRKRPRVVSVIAVLLTLCLLWAVLGLRFIVYPQVNSTSEIDTVDAVYVLGPAPPARMAKGMAMANSGLSDHLVVTVGENSPPPGYCSAQHSFTVHCVQPDPMTTGGESAHWARMAHEHQWDSIAVITNRPHITRAELYFSRCFDGRIWMIDDESELSHHFWDRRFLYESAAFVKYVFSNNC